MPEEKPKMTFDVRAHRIDSHGSEATCKSASIVLDTEILIDTDESDHRLALLHDNVMKYGTVYNTVMPGTSLKGVLKRTA